MNIGPPALRLNRQEALLSAPYQTFMFFENGFQTYLLQLPAL
jgi:hypothetical protein